ncbi:MULTISPECIES: SSI family serine proteinase inhibitor [unclassified Streptomyces]|uniref:SSI family serine proteinase inhibitor n=1 Tax=Streptomyces sp. NPDC127129 TaxID=3345373 RepID=UPI00363B8A37
MLRSLVLATLATLATLAATTTTAAGLGGVGGLGPLPSLPLLSSPDTPTSSPDTLTVTITKSGHRNADGTFELECGDKPGGTHPAAARACARLDGHAEAGRNPFAPVAEDRICSLQHGGPATARITGQWRGRTVDARFSRADGCEIERWENLEPVLPHVR